MVTRAGDDTSYNPLAPISSWLWSNNPSSNLPLTQAELANRQRIALAMAARKEKGYPKNVGEGIASLGESIGDTLYQNRLDAATRQAAGLEINRLRGAGNASGNSYVPGVPGGPPAGAPSVRTTAAPSPVPTAAASNDSTNIEKFFATITVPQHDRAGDDVSAEPQDWERSDFRGHANRSAQQRRARGAVDPKPGGNAMAAATGTVFYDSVG